MVTVIAATVSISAVFSLNDAQGQIIILSPIAETLDNTISLNILFANNTNATLVNEPITEAQGNATISAINALLEAPEQELDPILEEQLEELQEEEEEEEDELDNGNDGNGGGNGNDNGDDNGDDVDEEVGEDTDDLGMFNLRR